jgi:hypothetical protein
MALWRTQGAGGLARWQRRIARCGTIGVDGVQREAAHFVDDGPLQLHRVVLLGHRPKVRQVVGREVDAADETQPGVDDDQLAVHAPPQVQLLAEQPPSGVEGTHLHSGVDQRADEGRRQVGRAEAVDQQVDAHAAARGRDQHRMQFEPDLVLEQDEGLDDDLAARSAHRVEHCGEVLLSVLEQMRPGALGPVRLHSSISAASGAWSDSRAQGRSGIFIGACARAFLT